MASALIGGAALGAVAGELLKAIINFKKRAVAFKSQLEHLESTLLSLNPRCEELEELYRKLGRYPEIEEFIRSLNKGKGLVEKCSKVHSLNIYSKAEFSKDLQKLDHSIIRFCNVDLPLHISTTVMRTAIITNEMSKKFHTYFSIGQSSANKTGFGLPFYYSPKKPPPFTVGLEEPLRELTIKLIEDTETVLVYGPVGCGKTTLAKLLCHDLKIKGKFGDNIFFLTLSDSEVPDETALSYLKIMMYMMAFDSPKLLVLDGLLSESEHLIDRFSSEVPDLTILVTSRCCLRRFRCLYQMQPLCMNDSKELICKSAFHPNDPLPDADILDKIIRICYGSPIALTVVCKTLWVVWQKKLMEMSNGQTIFYTEEVVLRQLRQSIDDLKVSQREIFLNLLPSFPEDVNIPVATLIDISVELHKQCLPDDLATELYMQDDVHVPTLPNKTRRKAITHLEEELAEVNAGIISQLSRKKKITKLLFELRYPDEEEADDDSEDASDYKSLVMFCLLLLQTIMIFCYSAC